jgi:hypothetical protein
MGRAAGIAWPGFWRSASVSGRRFVLSRERLGAHVAGQRGFSQSPRAGETGITASPWRPASRDGNEFLARCSCPGYPGGFRQRDRAAGRGGPKRGQ